MKQILFISLLIPFFLAGCAPKIAETDSDSIQVSTSFYPLTFFAEEIGGDVVTVTQISGSASNAHSFEPQPRDVVAFERSDLFLYNGLEFDTWAEKLAAEKPNLSVAVAEKIVLPAVGHALSEDVDSDEHNHGDIDPHAWLDPVLAQSYVSIIEKKLAAISPENASYFRENTSLLNEKLRGEHRAYQDSLKACSRKSILVSHNSFQYVANRYGFIVIPVAGFSPNDEPTAKEFGSLMETAKDQQFSHIFLEDLVSQSSAHAFADELGLEVLSLSPLEGISKEQQQHGEDYITILHTNLKHLQEGLECR